MVFCWCFSGVLLGYLLVLLGCVAFCDDEQWVAAVFCSICLANMNQQDGDVA